jgi:hypothetical protein
MQGWPVWLASISYRDRSGHLIPASAWGGDRLADAQRWLMRLLTGLGDPTRERFFRMQITACLHRAISQREYDRLPEWWHTCELRDLAGGPVEVFWHRGIPDAPSTRPCANPGREVIDPRDDRLWLPIDCGSCESCQARATVRPRAGGRELGNLAPPTRSGREQASR